MDEAAQHAAPAAAPLAAARPAVPGILGLVVCLVAISLITGVISAAILGAGALVYAAVFGWGGLRDGLETMMTAVSDRDMGSVQLFAYVLGAVIYIAAAIAMVAVAAFRGRRAWREVIAWRPWAPWRAGLGYWLIVAGGIVYGVVAGAVIAKLYPPSQEWFTKPVGPLGGVLSLVLVAVLAPLAEETLFRGWIFTSLRSVSPFPVALVASAALFALAHWENTHLYSLVVFPLGLLLGWIRERTGCIKASATFHALFNFCGWLLAYV